MKYTIETLSCLCLALGWKAANVTSFIIKRQMRRRMGKNAFQKFVENPFVHFFYLFMQLYNDLNTHGNAYYIKSWAFVLLHSFKIK